MNYIKQINGFWAKCENEDLSATEIAVYMGLLHYCNKLGWHNPFKCQYYFICQYARVSKNTYYANMEKLLKKGYINFVKGERNVSPSIVTIINLESKTGTVLIQNEEQDEELNIEQRENLYKQLNKKTIKLLNNNIDLLNNYLEFMIKNFKNNNEDNSTTASISSHSVIHPSSAKKAINDFKGELLSNTKLLKSISHKYKLANNVVQSLMNLFVSEQDAIQKQYSDITEVASHCSNWIGKNSDKILQLYIKKSSAKMLGKT